MPALKSELGQPRGEGTFAQPHGEGAFTGR